MKLPIRFGRLLGMLRLWTIASVLLFSVPLANAVVIVAPTETVSEAVIDQRLRVEGSSYSYFTLALKAGAQVRIQIQVAGGLDSTIQTWLVDLNNFQLLKAGQEFNTWEGASPQIRQQGSYIFNAPATSIYYLVLDNRSNLFGRDMTVRAERSVTAPNSRGALFRSVYEGRYEALKQAFIFPDFDIHVQSCGQSNAFSNPNITMCTELFDDVQRKGVPAAELFIFYHEVGHSLLNLWHYPGYDNEDTADEFATAVLMMMDQQDVVLQAAQWWAANDSHAESGVKLLVDDRHSISIQRARNMLNWLGREDEIASRWMSILIPNLTDAVLEDIATGESENPEQARLVRSAGNELRQRRQPHAQ